LSDINFITSLQELKEINLSDNRISNIGALKLVERSLLWYVDLSYNALNDLEGIDKLSNLRILSISNNSISSLSPLSQLSELRSLFMDNNDVVSLSPLGDTANLLGLYAANNKITDPYGIIGLEKLMEALLWGNEIDQQAQELLRLARPQTAFGFD